MPPPPVTKAARWWFPDGPSGAELGALNPPSVLQRSYVDQIIGDDQYGDGSEARPWLTITRALDAIKDAGSTKPYTLVITPGWYNEILTAKDYVYFGGVPWFTHIAEIDVIGSGGVVVNTGIIGCQVDTLVLTDGVVDRAILCDVGTATIAKDVVGSVLVMKQGTCDTLIMDSSQAYLSGCPITNLTISGAGCVLDIDAMSLPTAPGSINVTPPATIVIQTGNAVGLSYTPTTPGDWAPAPDQVRDALDQCAARLQAGGL